MLALIVALLLLVAPAGDSLALISVHQEAFEGGAKGAYLDQNKQFNQNYTWSFAYLKYRGQ